MEGYFGNKGGAGAYQAIISQMPPHDTYIETHLGSGVVLRRKPAAARSIGIEIDPETLRRYPPPDGVEVVHGDCLAFLRSFDFATAGRVVLYADPPYVMETRSRVRGKRYRHDYTDQDHRNLLAVLRDLPSNVAVILSGYPSTLYDDALPGWRTYEFQVMTRGGPRTEKLWLNFPPGRLQWADFAGLDFTDRQRIKRKAERWRDNFKDLPECERQAILSALLDCAEREPAKPYVSRSERSKKCALPS